MTENKTIHNSEQPDRSRRLLDAAQQLNLTVGRMPFGYIVWDADFCVLEWNPAAEKIFGWTLEQARGRKVGELMLPGAGSPPDCMRKALEQGDRTIQTVCAGVNSHGERVVCEWHNTAVRDEAGLVRGMISMIHDVSTADQTDRELRESRKFLQTVIDSEPECVKLLDADGNLIMMNRAGLDMVQAASLDEVKGRCVCPLISEKDRGAFNDLTAKVFKGGTGTLTFQMTGLHGRTLWLETHAVPLRNDRDQVVALLGITRDVTQAKETEEIIKHERDFTDAILDTVGAIICVLDKTGRIVRFNRACEAVSGYSAQEVLGKFVWDMLIPPEQIEAVKKVFSNLMAGNFPSRYENAWVAKDGTRKMIAWSNTALLTPDGSVEFVIPTGIDVSERKRLEDQLRHAQKMESIGTLAGGVAHDFNNILTAIIGYASLLQMKMKQGDTLRANVEQILSSANRAATLTQGLLAYSRKQVLVAQPTDVNGIIRNVELLLKRLIGEDIELKMILSDEDVTVLVDAGQIEQVLMNLATNARDAMPDGGYLYIETERIRFDAETAALHQFVKPGPYVLISVTDSGMGIDEKTRERIFDPFFTTKETGKGTGLGLSIAYGIIKQHNGVIQVYSEPGKGSTFKIYLPAAAVVAPTTAFAETAPIVGGSETVLLAEDDELVRELTSNLLQQFGYRIIEAVDGEDAVNKFMENRDSIKLLLLDVIMPKKNGREVYTKIRIFDPGVKALFLSGYTADVMHEKGLMEADFNFVMKPVPVNELLRKIRSLLDETRS